MCFDACSYGSQPRAEISPPSRLGRGGPHLDDLLDPFRHATLEGQHSGGEDFPRLADLDEGRLGDLPPGLAGDAQAVDVGLDAVVKLGESLESVVGCADGVVAEEPEDRRLLRRAG